MISAENCNFLFISQQITIMTAIVTAISTIIAIHIYLQYECNLVLVSRFQAVPSSESVSTLLYLPFLPVSIVVINFVVSLQLLWNILYSVCEIIASGSRTFSSIWGLYRTKPTIHVGFSSARARPEVLTIRRNTDMQCPGEYAPAALLRLCYMPAPRPCQTCG